MIKGMIHFKACTLWKVRKKVQDEVLFWSLSRKVFHHWHPQTITQSHSHICTNKTWHRLPVFMRKVFSCKVVVFFFLWTSVACRPITSLLSLFKIFFSLPSFFFFLFFFVVVHRSSSSVLSFCVCVFGQTLTNAQFHTNVYKVCKIYSSRLLWISNGHFFQFYLFFKRLHMDTVCTDYYAFLKLNSLSNKKNTS